MLFAVLDLRLITALVGSPAGDHPRATLVRLFNMRHLVASLALTFALAACGSSTESTHDPALDGPWSSHGLSVGVVLTMTWTSDSVHGAGTYTVVNGGLGCGGGTLHGSGTVSFVAGRSGSDVLGHMSFDNGWTPPYRATLAGSTLDGAFLSIDAGSCPFALFHGLVP